MNVTSVLTPHEQIPARHHHIRLTNCYNHVNHTRAQVDTVGNNAVRALADTAFYLCSHVQTITQQQHTLPSTLAELGLFFVRVDDPAAVDIKADPAAYHDTLSDDVYDLRVGKDASGSLNPPRRYYMYRYYRPVSSRKRTLVGGKKEHQRGKDMPGGTGDHVKGISLVKIGAW